ncbi:MAG: 4-hydroxy-tetrahydrodipicolinate reductase [Deltaproteobacteria bacterium]|jgi:4-hydroxy-tetrahydrodipicolinate reductase|nr:4-hydroxy-tetrahydrodipicolinate reductase [Deltaproteobacteria bacterium]
MANLNLLLVGATGGMGHEVIAAVKHSGKHKIIGGIIAAEDLALHTQIAGIEFPLTDKWNKQYSAANVIVDFSSLAGAKVALSIAAEQKIPALICSTGLDASIDEYLAGASSVVPVLQANNTSLGIAVMHKLLKLSCEILDESFDIEISEIHHNRKKDAPSGTALALGKTIVEALNAKATTKQDFDSRKKIGRTGNATTRCPGELGIQAIRGGNVAGEHTVYFLGEDERLEIRHVATSRRIFANGALRLAENLLTIKTPGLYSVPEVLNV